MKRFLEIITAGILFLLIWVSSAHAVIKIEVAEIQNGVTYIKGNGAVLGAQITWEGGLVTTANMNNGGFSFFGVLPTDCTGELSDSNETVAVQVLGCAPAVGADCTDPPNIVPGADLRRCDLVLNDLSSADLRGADLGDANLSGANLSSADLSLDDLRNPANLSGADLVSANLTNADLAIANLTNAILFRADLSNADLFITYLKDANLVAANLTDANMLFARLEGADLSGANLSGANLSSADLNDANLSDANLSGATLTPSSASAAIWDNTTCPDGSNSNADDGDSFTCLNNLLFP